MANIMAMKDLKNNLSRNGFDLSAKINFTAKAGELLPFWWRRIVPTDSFKIDLSSLTRTIPATAPAFARMRAYYDFYFVPYSQIWNKFNTAITQMNNNVQHASGPLINFNKSLSGYLPNFTLSDFLKARQNLGEGANFFGYQRAPLQNKLLSYLGLSSLPALEGDASISSYMYTTALNVMPLLCYQKLYNDWHRDTQWEKPNPSTFNCDYLVGSGDVADMDILAQVKKGDSTFTEFNRTYNFFDLRYCNFQKDIFHGMLPQAQFGEGSVALIDDGTMKLENGNIAYSSTPTTGSNTYTVFSGNVAETTTAGISILALRRAEAAQKWREISQAHDEDYKSQIKAHYGQTVSDYLSGKSRYLGGIVQDIKLGEVVNTNITGENPAELAGKGIGSCDGKITFESQGEYGILMGIYHILPIPDYITSGIGKEWTDVQASDYPIPEFDRIGMESIPVSWLTCSAQITQNSFIGYAPRYISEKTAYDRSLGAFQKTLLNWIVPYTDEDVVKMFTAEGSDLDNPNVQPGKTMRYPFFKCNPNILDGIFASDATSDVGTDQFLNQVFLKISAVRPFDRDGLPW